MPTRNETVAPLQPVHSVFIDGLQLGILDQRAAGAANSMATGLNTPSASHKVRTLLVSVDNQSLSPPITGKLDESIDWRDREIDYCFDLDPTRDIRWGFADDDKQPLYTFTGTLYTRLGLVVHPIGPSNILTLYVGSNGALYMGKAVGKYVRGYVKAHAQGKDRS
jgi:hypothetical protein